MGVQRHRGRQDDEVSHDIGKRHAHVGIDLYAPQMRLRLLRRFAQRLFAGCRALLLHLLRRLPEEQVRTDGGAEHGHQHHEVVGAPGQVGHERVPQHLRPWNVDDEHRRHVGKQRQGQELEDRRIARKWNEHLQAERQDAEEHDVKMRLPADQQLQRGRHRTEVGGEIDGVGDQQQADHDMEQPRRIEIADIRRQAVPGDPADARADDLDPDHQRQREEHRPQHAVAELRSRLGIAGNAARIVVGGTGDQAGTEALKKRLVPGCRSWHP